MNNPSPAWIAMITALSVSGLCIVLGYRLFMAGATGEFQITASTDGISFTLLGVAPGIGFAAFGMLIAFMALVRLIGKNNRK